ncbi:uncharacterized protein [Palaemon carinicauda]|uniref:uncharacterized protein n=1 Tax=Palaemon carinicauda TaxID=392227 RepID=UPI0035B5C982
MVTDTDREEIKVVLSKMKNGKLTGPDEIQEEVWKCLWEFVVDMLWDLMKKIHRMWRDSFLIPIFKEKGDVQNYNNYKAIKVLPHTMKLWERIIECKIKEETEIGGEQFGFMPGRSTTDALIALKQLMEKYREGQKESHTRPGPSKKTFEKKMDVAEMRMLRWMAGITTLDRVRDDLVLGTTKVTEVSKKIQEKRLLVWACKEERPGVCWEEVVGDGCSR